MPNSAKTTSSKSKISSEAKSTSKTILATLGKLSGSSNPDKDQTRYLCHKLLRLINDQETSRKEITSKGSLEILLLTLESCSDQGTCLALISTLAEIAREGHTSVKRLISHDATRVLLHTLSYIGPSLDWRLLFATVNLLAKIGPKDRRFALRARLTGALPVILSAVRSSYNHHCHLKLLPSALSVMKLSVTNSSVNAGLLGRGGAVNALYRIVNTLTRKQPIPLKACLSTLNLLIRQSKANATKAVGLGLVQRMLKMHQDYHKADCRYNRHVAIRKSMLNVIKNMAALKIGRKSFTDSNGLLILHSTCRDYLSSTNKLVDPLLNIAIVIIRRCQPKSCLPVSNSGCTFKFNLPGFHDQEQIEHELFEFDFQAESEDDEFDEDIGDQQETEASNKTKRRPSNTSVSTKSSAISDASVKEPPPTKQNYRTAEDLKMYDTFFPELTEYPTEFQTPNQPTPSDESVKRGEYQRPSTTSDALQGSQLRLHTRDRRNNLANLSAMSQDFRNMVIGAGQKATRSVSMESVEVNGTKFSQQVANNLLDFNSGSAGDELSNNLFYKAWKDEHVDLLAQPQKYIEDIQKLASQTKSMKEDINKLSKADLLGNISLNKTELQCNKKLVQRLIKSKVLDDLGRSLFPEKVLNQKIFDVTLVNPRSYDKSNIHVQENGSVLTCDIQPSLYNNSPLNTISTAFDQSIELVENEASNSTKKSNELVIDLDRVLLPSENNECDTSSATISDDTWPGLYFDANGADTVTAKDKEDTEKKSHYELSQPLRFDSRFESGNLRCAVRVREYEYDLVLNSDCNCNIHHQWFYFEVAGMKAGKSYRFNIINCEKKGSIANEGMQPVMFSVASARLGKPQWVRAGREVCYYRNHFLRKTSSAGGKSPTYFTLTFTVTFKFDDDLCYLAYHYPYTYTKLQMDINELMSKANKSNMYVRKQNFCETLSGNPVPVLTITALPFCDEHNSEKQAVQEMRSRPYIFLSSRVHPGESNASWTMRGTLRLLLTPPPRVEEEQSEEERMLAAVADELRRSYIFKVVPMLNPDGVINGHHRCSLSGEDLNRMWFDPSVALYPTVYHTKGLLQYLHSIQKAPLVYCDYHGHSRKMNVFLYGCSHKESINAGEASTVADGPTDTGYKTLPKLLNHFAAPFSFKNCSFVVEKPKVSTARVVVWKEIGVARSYTMESTYCGCDQGPLRGKQIGTKDLEKMGSKFCEVLLHLKEKNRTRGLPVFDSDNEEEIADGGPVDCDPKTEDAASPGCPMNSDAELTPDEEDDLAPLINSYFFRGASNPDFSFKVDPLFTSKEDMLFWRYDPNNHPDPLSESIHPEASGFVDEQLFFETSDAGRDQFLEDEVSHFQHFGSSSVENPEVFPRKVCPASGRLLYCSEEEEAEVSTTAPRPFESGLVLRKAPKPTSLKNGNIFENLLSLPDETKTSDYNGN